MRLRWRISLIVALAMVLPVAGFGYWAATTSTERAETEYRRRLDSTARVAETRLAERYAADRRAVERLCTGDFVIDRLLLDQGKPLRHGRSRTDDDATGVGEHHLEHRRGHHLVLEDEDACPHECLCRRRHGQTRNRIRHSRPAGAKSNLTSALNS